MQTMMLARDFHQTGRAVSLRCVLGIPVIAGPTAIICFHAFAARTSAFFNAAASKSK